MIVTPVRTDRITTRSHTIDQFLDRFVEPIGSGDIVAITSKVIALCEGNVRDLDSVSKDDLIHAESEAYLPRSSSKYNVALTIKRGTLIPSAGIDESNSGGVYVLWPSDPDASADRIWNHLADRDGHRRFGVVITDSTVTPLRLGVMGIAIAHAGFRAVNDLVGENDLFDRPHKVTQTSVAGGLAAAAVAVMGEAAEQTPIARLSDLGFVQFQERTPTAAEREALRIDPDEDLYAPVLQSVPWKAGRAVPPAHPT